LSAWCGADKLSARLVFQRQNTLKPFLGESHNALYRPTGFVSSLRVPEDYAGLLALTDTLEKYFDEHPDQTNPNPKVNVTAARAKELHDGLQAASLALEDHDTLLGEKQKEQDAALAVLRDRLRGVIGELKQCSRTTISGGNGLGSTFRRNRRRPRSRRRRRWTTRRRASWW
jgi:hypothetical protein